jgi:hypothetical protein
MQYGNLETMQSSEDKKFLVKKTKTSLESIDSKLSAFPLAADRNTIESAIILITPQSLFTTF